MAAPLNAPVVKIVRAGDTSKSNPVTIALIANPVLETPWKSGTFVSDPISMHQAAFDVAVQYIDDALYGNLPSQAERFVADPAIAPFIRVVSLFIPGLAAKDANALVAQDGVSNLLIARRAAFAPFLSEYGYAADVAYAVSQSHSHDRASAWFTSDDDRGPGVPFRLDGDVRWHRHFNLIPGTVAIHAKSRSLTALHEFGHALSSYTNGSVVDLYVDSDQGLNKKWGRPVPRDFAAYNGTMMKTDPSRNSLAYPASWQSYHCELLDATVPAVMDNFWLAAVPEHCQHDRITRQFLMERLLAKIAR